MEEAAAMEAARGKGKGTVTSLSSMFPVEEARKASQRVHETIKEKRKELDTLDDFIADNTNLINLVQRLPDELHHQIMVPFGKAAFFPGRLVHTNEFTVLLGEGYYAERTAKQTVDILKRRGKTLESQVDSLKAVIEDLKTEASFFDKTAAEAAEGLVEITEEYVDEDAAEMDSVSGVQKLDAPEEDSGAKAVDDEEYARIMSRFDELEREELEAEESEELEDDESEDNEESVEDRNVDAGEPEDDENVDTEQSEDDEIEATDEPDDDEYNESSDNLIILPKDHSRVLPHAKDLSDVSQLNDVDGLNPGNLSSQSRNRDESSHGKALMQMGATKPSEEGYVPPSVSKTGFQSGPKSKKVSFQIPKPGGGCQIVGTVTERLKASVQKPKPVGGSRPSGPNTDSLKAFSGTIVERTDNLPLKPEKQTSSQLSNSQSSRPVSRFKLQRRAQGLS